MIKLLIMLTALSLIPISAIAEYDTTPSWKEQRAKEMFSEAITGDNVSSYEKQLAKVKATEDFKDKYNWIYTPHERDLWNI